MQDLASLPYDEVLAISNDREHPQRDEANELLLEIQADFWARHTPAGGEA